ncbi:winged helix-turn-helix transcriptional regulator [Citrobacter werkmanii]|nr:hypothetical protein CFNIH1_02920 [Citrobacter freundii CFNIH1]KAA0551356.1 winged helix-turn-helix transcriptional regulator [Citrobacter werkmanii]MBD0820775.1 winged helix-turn-helix transcriptional regulator [Citrobacter sp. C5_2]NSL33769.1 winged helix-turn-helix transcriptional regulator [Citrobacter werkmanii]HCR4013290.1 winged helix-turn-helix transcriptional regulator [Citrobacter werkmanii]
MSTYQPPFGVTPLILNQVIEIGELMGHWAAMAGRASPLLRKENRIRTIQASLAIEHNSLTREQVTALMEGKRILQILSNQPGRSAKSIAEECEISARTVERYLKALQLKHRASLHLLSVARSL